MPNPSPDALKLAEKIVRALAKDGRGHIDPLPIADLIQTDLSTRDDLLIEAVQHMDWAARFTPFRGHAKWFAAIFWWRESVGKVIKHRLAERRAMELENSQ